MAATREAKQEENTGQSAQRGEEDDEEDDLIKVQYKVILLGDGAVGKTSIAMRYAEDKFQQTYKQTVGVDFHMRRLHLPPKHQVAVQLWDIGGQSIASKMVGNYVSGAHAVMLCYDITNSESFANLEDWYRIVLRKFEGGNLPHVALVGNKCDLRHMTAVGQESHAKFAQEHDMSSHFVSARNGDNVAAAFTSIAAKLAGVPVVPNLHETFSSVVPAQIIDSQRHDPNVNEGKVPEYSKGRNYRNCSIQ